MITRIVPYLGLEGRTREAISFYEKALNAKVLAMQTFGEMPPDPEFPLSEEARDRIAHAWIQIGNSEMMFSDTLPGQSVTSGDIISLCIMTDSAEETKKIFNALQEGGTVDMPIQETFWSPAYGVLTDKFGIQFQISTESKSEQ